MYLLLVRRAADLRDCNPGSADEEERDCVWAVLEAYEAKRPKERHRSGQVWRVTGFDRPRALQAILKSRSARR